MAMIEVYKATSPYGSSCHFGVESTARAWAGTNGTVERIEVREPPVLTVVHSPKLPTPDYSQGVALYHGSFSDRQMLDYAQKAAEAERKACHDLALVNGKDAPTQEGWDMAQSIARAIRARGSL